MSEEKHVLHKKVGDTFKTILENKAGLTVKLDNACGENPGGKKNLPFFLSVNAGNDTEITNVDIIVLKQKEKCKVETVKLVCEIEESDITPIRTFGKVFTAATSIMCKLNDETKYDVDKKGIFIQILSNKDLKEKSKKAFQGANIEDAINDIFKSNGSWIKEYHLIYGDVDDFDKDRVGYTMIENIVNAL